MRRRFIMMGLALSLVFGALLAWNVLRDKLRTKYLHKHATGPKTATVADVLEQPWQPMLTSVGTLQLVEHVQVRTQVGGKVTQILFEDGTELKEGDLLLVLDDAVQQAQLAQAVTQRDAARDTVQRYESLLAEGAISQLHYDNLEAKYRESQAQVARAQAQLELVRISAPFSGRAGIGQVSLGQLLEPGTNIVTLATEGHLDCDFSSPESDRNNLHVGQDVTLRTDTQPGQSFPGKITEIDQNVDPAARNFNLRASFPNDDDKLIPGAFVKVEVPLPARDEVIAIPRTAIVYTLYGDTVYVLDPASEQERDGKLSFQVKKVPVSLGEEREDQVVISQGLQAGDKIVTSGQLKLEDGDWVTPEPSELKPLTEPPLD